MPLWVKDNSSWKPVLTLSIKDSSTWKRVYALWVKDAGTWKKVFPVAGTITLTADTTWTVPQYETLTVECYGGGAGGAGGGANEGFSFGSWGGQGGFGGQTIFGSSTPIIGFGGIGGRGGTDGVAGDNYPYPGTVGGGTYGSNTWGLCHAGGASAGAPPGVVGGMSLFAIVPDPVPLSFSFTDGQIIANGGGAGGAGGAGGGTGVIGGAGGAGGYTKVTFHVRDSSAPQPNSTVSVTVGQGGGGGGGAFDSGAQGQNGSVGTNGKVVLTWS